MLAWCHRVEGERQFRVDRVSRAELLDRPFTRADEPATVAAYEPRPDDPRVTIELPPGAAWVIEAYPVEGVEDAGDGRVRATLAISGRRWLERLLLRLGPEARIVDQRGGAGDLRDAAAGAAERVLARYRSRPA